MSETALLITLAIIAFIADCISAYCIQRMDKQYYAAAEENNEKQAHNKT